MATGIPVAVDELVDTPTINEWVRTHWRKNTAKAVTNTVAETDLLNGEITIGAGALGSTKGLRLTAWGDWIQNSGGNLNTAQEFKLKLGATVLIDTGAMGPASGQFTNNANRLPWKIVAEILNLGATNSQWVSFVLDELAAITGSASSGISGAFTTGEGGWSYPFTSVLGRFPIKAIGGNTAAVDTTVAQALALTVINPTATATCETKLLGATVEAI